MSYPEHVGILEIGLRVSLLSVDEVREFCGILDEEDWGVVEDPVPVALLGLELDGETTRVTSGIGRAGLSSYGRETYGCTNLFAL